MKDPKTTLVGLVLIACGVYLIVSSRHMTPDAMAIVTAGAGMIAAADSKKA